MFVGVSRDGVGEGGVLVVFFAWQRQMNSLWKRFVWGTRGLDETMMCCHAVRCQIGSVALKMI